MPLPPSCIIIILTVLLSTHISFAGDNLLPAPPNCATAKIRGVEYVKGEVYMSCHQDTAVLKEFGFRNFYFVGRAFRSVKYFALWPKSLDVRALPETVTGLNYDRPPDEMVVANLEKTVTDPEVQVFLNIVPEKWSAWPNVSDIRGSGVTGDAWGWQQGGFQGYDYVVPNCGALGTAWGRMSRVPTSGPTLRSTRSGLRPNDFGILEGYKRDQNGQLYRR